MNSNPISSMTRLDSAPGPDPQAISPGAELVNAGPEMAQLVRLHAVLQNLAQLLSAGKPEAVPELCREVSAIAHELSTLYSLSLIGTLAEDSERRKTSLQEIRRGHALCGALLRRWRRLLAFRMQAFQAEAVTYTPALMGTSELK